MSFVQGGAGKLRVSDGGQGGVPVVLVHGLGSELETWRPVLDRLRSKQRTIAYDQRGHGQSDRAAEYSVEALADDLEVTVVVLAAALGDPRLVPVAGVVVVADDVDQFPTPQRVQDDGAVRAEPLGAVRTGPAAADGGGGYDAAVADLPGEPRGVRAEQTGAYR